MKLLASAKWPAVTLTAIFPRTDVNVARRITAQHAIPIVLLDVDRR